MGFILHEHAQITFEWLGHRHFPGGPYSRPHQPADGLIHHRPVIDGEKLLADSLGHGV